MHRSQVQEDREVHDDPIVLMSNESLNVSIPDGEPVLFTAVRHGDLLRIESQLQRKVDLNETFEGGMYSVHTNTMAHRVMLASYCVIHLAALHSTCEVFEKLLESGADKDAVDKQFRTPLHLAAIAGRTVVVKLLIKKGAKLDVQSSSGRTPLLEAIFNDCYVIARPLIEAGADLDLKDTKGTSVLHHLCHSRRPNMHFFEYVLSKKCDVNITNPRGCTPIMFASSLKAHFSSTMVKLLLEHGANINQTDKAGHSAIHFVVEYKTLFEKTGVILLFLIQHGASTNIVDRKGKTLLDFPIKNMSIGSMKCLLLTDCYRDSEKIMGNPQMQWLCDQVPQFKEWLIEELYSPRSLMRCCRQTLRSCLSPDGLTKVDQLDLPKSLQDFILCKDIQMHHLVS